MARFNVPPGWCNKIIYIFVLQGGYGFHKTSESMPDKRITIHIRMKPYLKAFLVSLYGPEPIFIPHNNNNDIFINQIEILLDRPPIDRKDEPFNADDYVEIILPYFKTTNIISKNYISENSQKIFESYVSTVFWNTFKQFMVRCYADGKERMASIYLFMERYNLSKNMLMEDALKKQIYRSESLLIRLPKRKYGNKRIENTKCNLKKIKVVIEKPVKMEIKNVFMNQSEAANYLGICVQTIIRWKNKKKIPHYQIGRKVYYKKDEILLSMKMDKIIKKTSTKKNNLSHIVTF